MFQAHKERSQVMLRQFQQFGHDIKYMRSHTDMMSMKGWHRRILLAAPFIDAVPLVIFMFCMKTMSPVNLSLIYRRRIPSSFRSVLATLCVLALQSQSVLACCRDAPWHGAATSGLLHPQGNHRKQTDPETHA